MDRVNSMEGSGSKVSTQGIREVKTADQTIPGTVKALAYGREVVYCRYAATAIATAKIVQGPAQVANHSNIAVAVTASIGAKKVSVTLGATALTAEQYQYGQLLVNDAQGEGYTYMVDSHGSAAASGTAVIRLKDGLETTLTTASEVTLVPNQYNGVFIPDSGGNTADVVGVTLISGAASVYAWLGKCGPWGVTVQGTPAHGGEVVVGTAPGTVAPITSAVNTNIRLGRIITTAASTEQIVVNFKL